MREDVGGCVCGLIGTSADGELCNNTSASQRRDFEEISMESQKSNDLLLNFTFEFMFIVNDVKICINLNNSIYSWTCSDAYADIRFTLKHRLAAELRVTRNALAWSVAGADITASVDVLRIAVFTELMAYHWWAGWSWWQSRWWWNVIACSKSKDMFPTVIEIDRKVGSVTRTHTETLTSHTI